MKKKIFAFDLGKTSIGYCVREDHDIKIANSIIMNIDHGTISDLKNRKNIKKILNAHKAREKYFKNLWIDCGLSPLEITDPNFTKEFSKKQDEKIYNSTLLRIALLQNKKLENWQIYKALHHAIQRRGYDAELPWKTIQTDDDKANKELMQKYTQKNNEELIHNEEYKYPCYYDALRLGLWTENEPQVFKKFIPQTNYNKIRSTNYVAPRNLVVKEISKLWINAQSQLPELKKYSVEEFLYGEYREAYGSYVNKDYQNYLGTEHDWQGVLGQKIPRFNNRIIAKCKLLPKRNVCKAETIENVTLVLLLQLKNLRITTGDGENIRLTPEELKEIYENWLQKKSERNNKLDTTITKKEIETVVNKKIINKIEPIKVNLAGRSSFCRRACNIMTDFILSGKLYPTDIDISKYIDAIDTKNGITHQEVSQMLEKIGDWNNLYIPDNRDENAKEGTSTRNKTDIIIGNITNPIVRNRLQIFRDLLLDLTTQYGTPDEIIFEFVRDGADNSLFGRIKAQSTEKYMKSQAKENELIKKELEDANALNGKYFEMHKLAKQQCCRSVYSGQMISISDYDNCEIDHIYPRTMGGNDAIYNKVLCFRTENQDKSGRTPYEWLSNDKENWTNYVNRLNEIKKSLGTKKFQLLTSKPVDCAKLIESYNALAETSHIARVAQQIAAATFDWGLQVKDEKRHIFVNNGASTSAIRKRYGLNSLLGNDYEKNRQNDKHHALDAICISYAREFVYDKDTNKDIIKGFNPDVVKHVIDNIMPLPYTNKKPLKANLRPLETIHGLRQYGEKAYITKRVEITSIKEKDVKSIIDKTIQNDLMTRLEQKPTLQEWIDLLANYIHPKKKTKVKKVMIFVSEGKLTKDTNERLRLGEFCDFGTKGTHHQFKSSKGHKGQILYFNEKGTVKVMPLYANKNTKESIDDLLNKGCRLYADGTVFYAGCLIQIPKDFKAGANTHSAGVYKVRTIQSNGQIKLESSNGIELSTSANNLVQAEFVKQKS